MVTLSDAYCPAPSRDPAEQQCFLDNQAYAFVGYEQNAAQMPLTQFLFSKENLDALSTIITDVCRDLDEQGRDIVVPPTTIAGVLSSVLRNGTRTHVGDIFTRYTIPQAHARNDADNINLQTINIITSTVRNEFETVRNNKRLSVWNTVLGDFNQQGLRAYPPIKIRERAPQRMMFNMNY